MGWLCKLMASHLNITLVLLRKHNLEFIAIQNSPTSWLREMICTECHGSRVSVFVFKKTSNDFPHVGRVENHLSRSCNNSSELQEPDRGWCAWHAVQSQNFTFFFIFYFFICSEFCHTLKWNSHGFTCIPHPDPPSHLPLHPLPLGPPRAPGPSACLMHPTWAGDLFHPR